MKKILLLALFCILPILQTNAQCTAAGTAFGNNTSVAMYNVTGMVSVDLNSNNMVTLNLGSTFATASGPDVRVYIVDRGTLTNMQLRATNNFLLRPKIEMGMITANGAASFTKPIPSGMNISNFNTIYFYCQQFNQFWDFGSFTSFTNANCGVLATDSFANDNFNVYPNPSNGNFTIDLKNNFEQSTFKIYSALGQLISSNNTIKSGEKVITNLNDGIYFLEITNNNNDKVLKKIVVRKN